MSLGLVWGLIAAGYGWHVFTEAWIKPWGQMFVNALKLIAVPLVFLSLIDGVSNLHALSKLSRLGGKTMAFYLATTVFAIAFALVVVNIVSPGEYLSTETREALQEKYVSGTSTKLQAAEKVQDKGPLQPLVDIVPQNLSRAASSNRNMLQIIFFALLFGVAMLLTGKKKTKSLKKLIHAANEVMLKIVNLIMHVAPYAVFALLGSLLTELIGENTSDTWALFQALGAYVLSVLFVLACLVFLFYPIMIQMLVRIRYGHFMRSILPAQLLAFSTSSSAATLPVTMRCAEEKLGVSEEVSSFVFPLGATINMDGTSVHQAISAVFIAQAFGHSLDIGDQLTIVLTATLSSIGAAAVPGAGLIMLVIVLGAIGINPEGLALIIALDRPLDMCRTVVNVTGDATIATIVAQSEGALLHPEQKHISS